ncbi:FAD:protein FMN transferase [Brassicibacter mesophilus]|uniref:FAD:protein FMN transferase n=1 Tax=Brassicibacter mesophilus TaxID=745119 RepID=UPI003D21F25F
MRKNKNLVIFVLIIMILSSISVGCNKQSSDKLQQNAPLSKTGFFLDTVVTIKIYEQVPESVFTDIFNMIESIENKMSIHIKNSEVSMINEKAGVSYVKVSPETFYVIERGKYYSSLSDGHFDISIGPLVQLWGINSEGAKVPTQKELDTALSKIDYNKVLLNKSDSSVKLAEQGMIIDLGAIAKGYVADEIAKYLKSKDVKSAIIDLGGNVYALGAKSGNEPWSIGVQNPFEPRGKHIGILTLKDKTVVTSGIYERFFEENGKRYHHILNPFTGYPVENSLAAVAIVADKSIDADGLSTTIFSLGLKEGSALIETLDGIDAIFIDKDKNVYKTSGLKDDFNISNESFKLKDIE